MSFYLENETALRERKLQDWALESDLKLTW